jgi:hypothetical protein
VLEIGLRNFQFGQNVSVAFFLSGDGELRDSTVVSVPKVCDRKFRKLSTMRAMTAAREPKPRIAKIRIVDLDPML